MSEKEIFSQMLDQLKKISNTLEDLNATIEGQHEELISKLSVFESIADDARSELRAIESNSRQ